MWKRLGFLFIPYAIFSHIRAQVFSFAGLVAIAGVIYYHFQHLDVIGAVYAGISTISTIGLYAPYPLPDQEMVFLIVLIVLSVGILASTVQTMMTTIANREVWVAAKSSWEAGLLKNHTIVCGDGEVVYSVCKKLVSMRREFVVVTNSEMVRQKLGDGVPVLLGDPRTHDSLLKAGIKRAKAVVIVFEDDATSLIVTLNAEELNSKATTVVAVRTQELQDHFRQAGANVIIPINSVAGRVMAVSTVSPNVGAVIFSDTLRGDADLEIGVFEIETGSKAASAKISLLDNYAITLAVIRGKKIITYFDQNEVLQPGDRVMIMGNHEQFQAVEALVGSEPEEVKSIE